jgi:DNA-binding NarL/FixJ family response regulator
LVSGISKKIRVLIVDDHALILDGMRTILKRHDGITVVEEASSGEMAIDFCKRLEPDVIVMDVKLPRMDGVDAAKRILSVNGHVKVLVFSADFSNQVIDRALDAGITGFFSKSCGWKDFGEAIEAVYHGERYSSKGIAEAVEDRAVEFFGDDDENKPVILSERDREIVRLLTDGMSVSEAADFLGKSPKTIDNRRREIMSRIGVSNICELVKYAVREGISDIF